MQQSQTIQWLQCQLDSVLSFLEIQDSGALIKNLGEIAPGADITVVTTIEEASQASVVTAASRTLVDMLQQ
jgi:hypothetical protein